MTQQISKGYKTQLILNQVSVGKMKAKPKNL